jgi:2,4-dienoyl-CoA reductase-like NADH-dependent reductase (Old Yellow Enzyme family)
MQGPATATAGLEHVWQPLDIGPTRVKHRILYPAQTVHYGEDNLLSDRHIAFYRERAMGGAALLITEQQAGHWISKGFLQACIAYDERAVPRYAELAETVHEFGAKQFVQLFVAGLHDRGIAVFDDWHPLWAASRVTSLAHHEVPMAIGQREISEIAQAFGRSALNVKQSGLDGVEIHGAHGLMIGQFLSPAYNKRDDAYGGSVGNRCRFAIKIAEAVRRQVNGDITVGIRLSYDEFLGDAGITGSMTEEIVEILLDTNLFDYFSISTGSFTTSHQCEPPMHVPQAFLSDAGARVKDIVGNRAKVFLVGRVVDVEVADRLVASGATDMVGMARAQLADPFLVQKAREGRSDEIIRCINANVCEAHLAEQRLVPCVMNPATGREKRLGIGTIRRVASSAQKIVTVVGGGPAGMKYAATAAERGHHVVVLEETGRLGGRINLIKQLPTQAGWDNAITNLRRPLERLSVDVRLNTRLDPAAIAEIGADVVVCATGSRYVKTGVFSIHRPDRAHIPGAERNSVYDVASAIALALNEPEIFGTEVLIYDETGDYLPLGLAEVLAQAGASVEVVSPELTIGQEVVRSLEWNWIAPRLLENGVTFTPMTAVEAISDDSVELSNVYGGRPMRRHKTAVVLALPRIANDGPYHDLANSVAGCDEPRPHIRILGDAVAPRALEAVIYEAEVSAREL